VGGWRDVRFDVGRAMRWFSTATMVCVEESTMTDGVVALFMVLVMVEQTENAVQNDITPVVVARAILR
jgi:hypothetical protein